MKPIPNAFMSYSHDSPEHKKWVHDFSNELRSAGINIILDQWDLELGQDVASFIESNISYSDKVLIICTEQYVQKANAGKGGAGYEKTIVTRELIDNSQSNRFIPILRQYSGKDRTPRFLGTRLYADFSDDSKFEGEFDKLVRKLHDEPPRSKKPIGQIFKRSKPNSRTESGNLKDAKSALFEQDLLDFNVPYSFSYANTLNRLILDSNEYKNLNIIFDSEVDYIYESNPLLMWSNNVRIECRIYEFIYKYYSLDNFKN